MEQSWSDYNCVSVQRDTRHCCSHVNYLHTFSYPEACIREGIRIHTQSSSPCICGSNHRCCLSIHSGLEEAHTLCRRKEGSYKSDYNKRGPRHPEMFRGVPAAGDQEPAVQRIQATAQTRSSHYFPFFHCLTERSHCKCPSD